MDNILISIIAAMYLVFFVVEAKNNKNADTDIVMICFLFALFVIHLFLGLSI